MSHNIPLHKNKLSTECYIMRRTDLDKIVSDFDAAKKRKQFISVLEMSTDLQSDLIIHISRTVGN